MVVEMFAVLMSGYNHLKTLSPQSLCKFNPYLVAPLRGYLTGLKAHIPVVSNDAAGLAVSPFQSSQMVVAPREAM